MKLKKMAVTFIAAASLATCSAVAVNTNTVKATSFNYYLTKGLYHFKHKVVLLYPTTIRKVHFYPNSVGTYLKERKTLPAGTQVKIMPYGDKGYYWIVNFGHSKYSSWVYPPKSTNWFETYSKHIYLDVSAFKYVKYGTQYYEFTWPQYVRLCKMNLWEATKSEKKAINRYVKSINPKIYPADSSKSSSKSTNTGSNSKGTYSENGSVHIYKDKNVMLRMNTHAIRPGQNQTIVELTVHNLTNKKMSLRDIISKHLEIQQDANLVDYDLTGTVRPHGVTSAMLYLHPQSKSPITFIFVSGNNAAGMFNYNLPHDYTQPNADNTKQSSASSSNNQSSSNTTSTSSQTNSSSTSSQFTGFPAGAGYMEKAKIIFSLSGDARKQADLQLMKDLGEVDAQGRPEVPIASFEAHLREMYDSVQRMSESIEHGGQTPLQFK